MQKLDDQRKDDDDNTDNNWIQFMFIYVQT
jgi:hypothetical protein